MELPVLRIGLLGFARSDANLAKAQILSASVSRCRWEVVPFEDADIWLINSPNVTLGEGIGNERGLHIANPDAPHSPLTIYPLQATRPVAFTEPLPQDIDAVLSIELGNGYQCASRLNDFASTLPQLCTHFALGEQVATRQHNLQKGTYHLHFEGRLVAVIDLQGWQAGLLPGASAMDMALASWRHRPNERAHMPPGFETHSLERLMWVYASRSKSPRLPTSYESETIHLRRLSVLPQSWLHQDHMGIIGVLSQKPQAIGELAQNTRLSLERLEVCLAALYYSGTITTDARQVVRGDGRVPSNFMDLELSEPGEPEPGDASPSEQEHSAGQSVFDTHSFAHSSAHH
jgi:hypothetical protein